MKSWVLIECSQPSQTDTILIWRIGRVCPTRHVDQRKAKLAARKILRVVISTKYVPTLGSLVKYRLSNKCRRCQAFFEYTTATHSKKSAIFGLVLYIRVTNQNQGSRCNRSGQKPRSDPCISSVATSIMITFELLREESRTPNQCLGVLIAHHGDIRTVPRANRTCSSVRNPIPSATSSRDGRPADVP